MIVNVPKDTCRIEVHRTSRCRTLGSSRDRGGEATVERILESEDVRSTAACLAALGVEIDWPDGSSTARVRGKGPHSLVEAGDVLDCGNSGTSMRLLLGLLAGQRFLSVLSGDGSLRSRPMARVINPLRQMGASISARGSGTLAPVAVNGGSLTAMDYASPMASAQVKSAITLAGLFAEGTTTVSEPEKSRDHTERMLSAMGADITSEGTRVTVGPVRTLAASLRVPG